MKKIEFIDRTNMGLEKPIPASKLIPEWYKKQESYVPHASPIGKIATIKKCMPIFDAISSGYIISTSVEIHVSQENGQPVFTPAGMHYLEDHPKEQLSEYRDDYEKIPKILNQWLIKTPKGYSCLFIPPLHRDNIIEILVGIVDTDTYNMAVNFPFTLKDKSFTGVIPVNTPIAQVIPFKRDSWQSILIDSTEKNITKMTKHNRKLRTVFFGGYKDFFWNKKDFK